MIDLKEFVLSKVFFLDGFVAPRFLNTAAERDPGNKAADSAHVMGSGGLAVVAVAIGCLGAERRGERFFRTWTFFNRRPPTTLSEVGRSAAGHIRAIKGSDGVSPVGARQDQPHNESCARCWVRKHLRTSAVRVACTCMSMNRNVPYDLCVCVCMNVSTCICTCTLTRTHPLSLRPSFLPSLPQVCEEFFYDIYTRGCTGQEGVDDMKTLPGGLQVPRQDTRPH